MKKQTKKHALAVEMRHYSLLVLQARSDVSENDSVRINTRFHVNFEANP
jgi:hypothetical protein